MPLRAHAARIHCVSTLYSPKLCHCRSQQFRAIPLRRKSIHIVSELCQSLSQDCLAIARPRRSTLCLCGTSNFSAFAGLVRSGPSWRIPYHRLTNASLHLALPLQRNAFRAYAHLAKRCFAHAMRVRTVLCFRKAYQSHSKALPVTAFSAIP